MGGRLRVVLAMTPALVDAAFTPAQWSRLTSVADVLDRKPLASFDDDRAQRLLPNAEVILGHWGCPVVDTHVLALAPHLRLLAYAAGTIKGVVTPAVWARGVTVTSAAAANAVPVAEFALGAILLANKAAFLSREWMRDPDGVKARRPKPVGNVGKRIGIVGASHVGRRVIKLLAPFDLEVVVADPYLDDEGAEALGVTKVELDELVATSDIVSLHAPDLPSTKQMIGAPQLKAMKDGAVFINTARGAIVDSKALEAELISGRISAVLDVTHPEPLPRTSPLLKLPNVFITPHIAGAQGSELTRLADLAIDEIERFAAGDPPHYPVRAADLDRIA